LTPQIDVTISKQGKEAYQLLHTKSNWDLVSGAPAEYMGNPDLPVDATVARDPAEWERWNNEIYDQFLRWFRNEPGTTQQDWKILKTKYGLRGGYPGLCGMLLSAAEIVVVAEPLHARHLGVGRAMMKMAAEAFGEELVELLVDILSGLQHPDGLWYPKVGFWGSFLKGEEHRVLHEAFPLVLESYRRRYTETWNEDQQLVLSAAAQYSAWCRDCDQTAVSLPEDLDKMAKGYACYIRLVRQMRVAFAGAGDLDDDDDQSDVDDNDEGRPSERTSRRERNVRGTTATLHQRLEPGDWIEYRCRSQHPSGYTTYVGEVGETITADRIEFLCDDDDTNPGVTTTTMVTARDFDKLSPIEDKALVRALWVREKFRPFDVTEDDIAQMLNGFKRRTAGYHALMVSRHGPSYLFDSGIREMTNKGMKKNYGNTVRTSEVASPKVLGACFGRPRPKPCFYDYRALNLRVPGTT